MQQQDATAWVRILDETSLPDKALGPGEINRLAAWRWGRIELRDPSTFTTFPELEPTSGSVVPIVVDGTTWSTQTDAASSRTGLVDLSGEDGPIPGTMSPGLIKHAFRVR